MKKILLIIVITTIIACNPSVPDEPQRSSIGDFTIRTIDNCEYIEYDYGFAEQRVYSITHKGNCKNHNMGTADTEHK